MEKVGLSFLIGAVVGASFKTSINGVKNSIGDINKEIKLLTEKRAILLDRKYNNSQAFLPNSRDELLKINKEIERLTNLKTIDLKFRSNINEVKSSLSDLMKFGGVVSAGAYVAARPIKIAIDFEQAMLNVKSVINGITDEQFKALNNEAKRLGATTSFSASEAAEGMKYLGYAGFSTNQIIAAMPGLLDMARAGVVDLGKASDISSNILSAFGISAGEMGRVADTLTMAFTTSNTTLESLGYTMGEVAPIAKEAGMSLEETAAMAGLLGNIGIQGSKAGTQLKAMVNRLSAPVGPAQKMLESLGVTVKDSAGNLRPMIEVLADMEKATAALGNADRLAAYKTIFGEEPIAGLSELVDKAGTGEIAKYIDIIKNSSGKASQVAAIQMSGLKGSLDELSSSLEGVAISFGEIMIPAIKSATEILTGVSGGINNLINNHSFLIKSLVTVTGSVITFIGGYKTAVVVMNVFGAVSKFAHMQALALGLATGKASVGVKLLAVAQAGLNTVMSLNPIALAVGAFAVAGVIIYKIVKNWDKIKEYFANFWEYIKQKFFEELEAIAPVVNFIGKAAGKLMLVTRAVSESVTWVGNKLGITDEKADFSINNLTRPAFELETLKSNKPVSEHIYQKDGTIDKYNKNIVNHAPITYAPNITVQGNANKQDILEAEKMSQREFEKMYKQQRYNDARLSYGGGY